ncbi:uncharacterized protein LOC134843616 isoform X2 [Symsagittifera roscoffensis]|uniref:uncharacterized protein LOC134843616 isoform X2 n=1 Tax=Symsagittifera roscoffensis TaxID=84072 RepID=UPI00307C480F
MSPASGLVTFLIQSTNRQFIAKILQRSYFLSKFGLRSPSYEERKFAVASAKARLKRKDTQIVTAKTVPESKEPSEKRRRKQNKTVVGRNIKSESSCFSVVSSLSNPRSNVVLADMLKLAVLFAICCYPTLAYEKSKNTIEFTSTYPKEMQVLRHDEVKINCPKLSGAPQSAKIMYFYRFQKGGPGQRENFINESEGQYYMNTKTGQLIIQDFDSQNEGRYSCAAMVSSVGGRVITSSTVRIVIGDKERDQSSQDNDLIVIENAEEKENTYKISKPDILLEGPIGNPILKVSWSTLPPSGVSSPMSREDQMAIEKFSQFIIQMKHNQHFFEDWHNLTLVDNTRLELGYYQQLIYSNEYETGLGVYRIVGMTSKGEYKFSPNSDLFTIPGPDHSHDKGEGEGGLAVPEITTCVSISDSSMLVEWKLDTDSTNDVMGFIIAYSKVNSLSSPNDDSSYTHPEGHMHDTWEQDVHVNTPNRRSYVIQGLQAHTQYQFRVQVVGKGGTKSTSATKYCSTTGGGAGLSLETTNPPNKSDSTENNLLLILVIGGCVSLVIIATVISLSCLVVQKQRLKNNITNKVIMREMEEEMKRRESSLRKSVGGVIYHQVAAALHQQHQTTSPTTTPTPPPTHTQHIPLQQHQLDSPTHHAQLQHQLQQHQLQQQQLQQNCPSLSSSNATNAFSQMIPSPVGSITNPPSLHATPPPMNSIVGMQPGHLLAGNPNSGMLLGVMPNQNRGSSASPSSQQAPSPSRGASVGFMDGWRFLGRSQQQTPANATSSYNNSNPRYLMTSSPQSDFINSSVANQQLPQPLVLSPSSGQEMMTSDRSAQHQRSGSLFVQPSNYDYSPIGMIGEIHGARDGSEHTSPLHSYQSSNVTALSSVGDRDTYSVISKPTGGPPTAVIAPSQLPYNAGSNLSEDQNLTDLNNSSSSNAASLKLKNSLKSLPTPTAEHVNSSPSSAQCCHEQQPCFCQQTTHTNIEQGSLLGSGCSEHSVNSSPVVMDDQTFLQHQLQQQLQNSMQNNPQMGMINQQVRQPTPPMGPQGLPSILTSSAFRAQPNVYEYNSMMSPNSIYNTNMTSMASSFHPIAEIRGPIIHSNLSSPVTTIALPQPLKTLNSPALIAKYTTGNHPVSLPYQNTYHGTTENDFASFKNLKDLSNNSENNSPAGFSTSTLTRGKSNSKSSGGSGGSLKHRNSIQNYTIDEDELSGNNATMSNYQTLSTGEQTNGQISQT